MSDLVPDILAPGLSVIFCGINPATTAAASGHNFSNHSNRFWPVLHRAGFTPIQLRADQERDLLTYGCGITAAAPRATTSAAELSREELAAAIPALERKVAHYAPGTIAFLGKPAWSVIAASRQIAWGPQAVRFGGASVWVLPNPSGLNRSFTLDDLTRAYADLRVAIADGTRTVIPDHSR
jgi:TDG/mug DNA glycosylase family protein